MCRTQRIVTGWSLTPEWPSPSTRSGSCCGRSWSGTRWSPPCRTTPWPRPCRTWCSARIIIICGLCRIPPGTSSITRPGYMTCTCLWYPGHIFHIYMDQVSEHNWTLYHLPPLKIIPKICFYQFQYFCYRGTGGYPWEASYGLVIILAQNLWFKSFVQNKDDLFTIVARG